MSEHNNNKAGLSLETAASVTLHDMIQQHMARFALIMRHDRLVSTSVGAEYINGLAGALALAVVGGFGSKDDVIDAAVVKLRECVDRDLRFLAGQ